MNIEYISENILHLEFDTRRELNSTFIRMELSSEKDKMVTRKEAKRYFRENYKGKDVFQIFEGFWCYKEELTIFFENLNNLTPKEKDMFEKLDKEKFEYLI